jgi:hypothetical protein
MAPPPPVAPFDFAALAYSIMFLALGFYLGVMWPRSIQKQIDEGEADASMGGMIWMLRLVGLVMLFYCLGDIVWRVGRALKLW